MKQRILTIQILTDDTESPLDALKRVLGILTSQHNPDDFKRNAPVLSKYFKI